MTPPSLLVLVGLIVALSVRVVGRPPHARAARPARRDRRPTAWFQLATYRNGRITHLTPMRNGPRAEDEIGECAGNPVSGRYALDGGGSGLFYVHRLLGGDEYRGAR